MPTIKENLNLIKKQTDAYGATLVVVTKTQPVEKLLEVYHAGHKIFGENRVQELLPKYEQLPKDIEWHLIGHLQTNKVKYIAPFIHTIHSVDSWHLLAEINKHAAKYQRVIHCLLQIYIAKEETKFGLEEKEARAILENPDLPNLSHIHISGLMGMATNTEDQSTIRAEFLYLKHLFDAFRSQYKSSNVLLNTLSMGMSSDYTLALECGSTIVRIGSMVFKT